MIPVFDWPVGKPEADRGPLPVPGVTPRSQLGRGPTFWLPTAEVPRRAAALLPRRPFNRPLLLCISLVGARLPSPSIARYEPTTTLRLPLHYIICILPPIFILFFSFILLLRK